MPGFFFHGNISVMEEKTRLADIKVISRDPNRVLLYLDHLRRAMIPIVISVLLCSIGGYMVSGYALDYLQHIYGLDLVAFGVPEIFFARLQLALEIGLLTNIPFILFKLLAIVPAMFQAVSRKMIIIFWFISVLLFYAGMFFCLEITLPYGIQYLLGFESAIVKPLISVRKFLSFCSVLLFGFGLVFEVPVVMVLLGRLGVVDAHALAGGRRYAILAIIVISAVLTPTPDVINLLLMGFPLYLLFEFGLLGMRLGKK